MPMHRPNGHRSEALRERDARLTAAPMNISRLADFADASRARTVVLKIGSSLLVREEGDARREWLGTLAGEIALMRARGQQAIVVSSGAIALGATQVEADRRVLADAQAAAAVGQIALAALWSDKLAARGLAAAQLLLTLDDLEDRRRYLNIVATLERLLGAGIVPVVNENDTVATEEIRFGDNDRLAARLAIAARADALVLLSDVDGLYEGDPAVMESRLVEEVAQVSPQIRKLAEGARQSSHGTGGMSSKLDAADIAMRAGIAVAIANGTPDAPLARMVEQERGTLFPAGRGDAARKGWIGARQQAAGALTVDAGCAKALATGGSLLAAGIRQVEGQFARGDLVSVVDDTGNAVGQGLVEYAAEQCRALAGRSSDMHAEILGHAPRSAVIHRDQMVLA